MVSQIHVYPTEQQLNKAYLSETEALFLDMDFFIINGIVSNTIYDEKDDFKFEIVNFLFLNGDVTRAPSYGKYIFRN